MNEVVPIVALGMGLLGGAHCVAMCGGIVGVLCSGLPKEVRESPARNMMYLLGYNGGRIASYVLAGCLAGGLGALTFDVLPVHLARGILTGVAGLTMVGLGLHLLGFSGVMRFVETLGVPLWRAISPHTRRLFPVHSVGQASLLGALWGWVPCGMVYTALLTAVATGSSWGGAVTMAAFGVGTLPALLAVGTLSGVFSKLSRWTWGRRMSGVMVLVLGVASLATLRGHADGDSSTTCCHTRK